MMNKELTDLQWRAFQYIAGELATSESAAFEARLETDQAAREAVAQVVELTEIVALAERRTGESTLARPASVSSMAWSRKLAWMACGAAACLVFVLLAQPFSTLRWGSSDTNLTDRVQESPELALAWAQTRDTAVIDDTLDGSDSVLSTETDASSDDSLDTPSWMLTAVAGLTLGMEEVE